MNVISFIVGIVLVISAIVAIEAKRLITSVVMLSLSSLLAVVSFVLLKAPDVAITEASVGAGFTTAIFLLTLKRLGRGKSE